MSDTQQGADWWQASDLKWYPPELNPNYQSPVAEPEPSPPVEQPAEQPPVADGPPFPGWWQANDQNWYPPEMHPNYQSPQETIPEETPPTPSVPTNDFPPPSNPFVDENDPLVDYDKIEVHNEWDSSVQEDKKSQEDGEEEEFVPRVGTTKSKEIEKPDDNKFASLFTKKRIVIGLAVIFVIWIAIFLVTRKSHTPSSTSSTTTSTPSTTVPSTSHVVATWVNPTKEFSVSWVGSEVQNGPLGNIFGYKNAVIYEEQGPSAGSAYVVKDYTFPTAAGAQQAMAQYQALPNATSTQISGLPAVIVTEQVLLVPDNNEANWLGISPGNNTVYSTTLYVANGTQVYNVAAYSTSAITPKMKDFVQSFQILNTTS